MRNFAHPFNARVAELVDALDSKSSIFGCAGSIPAPGTKEKRMRWRNPDYSLFGFTDCATHRAY